MQLLSLLNALVLISCKSFTCVPFVICVIIDRELKYIDHTFPHVMLLLDSTKFLFEVFRRVFLQKCLLELQKRENLLLHLLYSRKQPKMSVRELYLCLFLNMHPQSSWKRWSNLTYVSSPTFKSHFADLLLLWMLFLNLLWMLSVDL